MTLYLFGKIYNILDNLSTHWIERWYCMSSQKEMLCNCSKVNESKFFWQIFFKVANVTCERNWLRKKFKLIENCENEALRT